MNINTTRKNWAGCVELHSVLCELMNKCDEVYEDVIAMDWCIDDD
jgi:hypothetical protein